jgi:hypothetical protein
MCPDPKPKFLLQQFTCQAFGLCVHVASELPVAVYVLPSRCWNVFVDRPSWRSFLHLLLLNGLESHRRHRTSRQLCRTSSRLQAVGSSSSCYNCTVILYVVIKLRIGVTLDKIMTEQMKLASKMAYR